MDGCAMISDRSMSLQFVANVGGTWTQGTGPPSSGFQKHGIKTCFIIVLTTVLIVINTLIAVYYTFFINSFTF